jgi:hypothetical protein
MAITIVQSDPDITGYKVRVARVTFDDAYASGGESLTAAQLGFEYLAYVLAEPVGGYTFTYDYAAQKLKAFWVDTTVDGAVQSAVATNTDMALIETRVLAVGR